MRRVTLLQSGSNQCPTSMQSVHVKLQNVEGVIQTCEVSSYTALVTGSGSRDSVINKCISELEHAGYKVVSTKSNMWESNN